jgi:hypothetical protein
MRHYDTWTAAQIKREIEACKRELDWADETGFRWELEAEIDDLYDELGKALDREE